MDTQATPTDAELVTTFTYRGALYATDPDIASTLQTLAGKQRGRGLGAALWAGLESGRIAYLGDPL